KDARPRVGPPHPPLVTDRVRHVGDQVAVVIAETLGQARDAAELIQVDYVEEPAAIDPAAALQPGAPQVHGEAPGNLCYDWHLGDLAAVEAAFAKAGRVVKLDLTNNRLVPNAMEPRAAIGEFNRATGEYTLYTTSQNPHVIRLLMGAFVLHIPEAKLRVVAPDVGGGFGSKIYHYAEEAIVTWAAGKMRRPIKWTAERSESFMSDAHGRDHVTHVELALDQDAKFLALKVSTIANMGAYLSTFAPAIPTYLYGTLLAGTYTTPAIYVETKAVFTNTVPVDLYRGLRHRPLGGRRLARRPRRALRMRRGARPPDRQRHGADRLSQSWARTRDDIFAARLGYARHPDRECRDRPWRHRQDPLRH